MAFKTSLTVALAATAGLATCKPLKLYGTEHMSADAVANITQTYDRQMLEAFNCGSEKVCPIADIAGSTGRDPHPVEIVTHLKAALDCSGQSCLIADTAGSTGRGPMMKAEGANDADIKCIIAHNPAVGEVLTRYFNKPPDVPKQDTGVVSTMMIGLNSMWRPLVAMSGSTEKGSYTGSCAKNILIFAKGTFEPGTYGVFIGPSFTSGLPSDWTTAGVAYDVDIPGDFCLGLPGGMVAKDVINGAAAKCPSSNIFVSGYSQGAMAIRNGLARADPSARARVKGVITFGDPFNGANIKGYDGPISIFCNRGDGVCTGNFEVAGAHLSYGSDGSASLAQAALFRQARGLGDSRCCRPRPEKILPSPEQWRKTLEANGGKIPQAPKGTSVSAWEDALVSSNGGIPKVVGGFGIFGRSLAWARKMVGSLQETNLS